MGGFKDRLSRSLANMGWRTADLARAMGINQQNIVHWKKRGSPPTDKLFELAEILKVDPQWLVTGKRTAQDHTTTDQMGDILIRVGSDTTPDQIDLIQRLIKQITKGDLPEPPHNNLPDKNK